MISNGLAKSSLGLNSVQNVFKRNHVIFMDRSLIILNKPAGLVAQGGRHLSHEKTLDAILDDLTMSLYLSVKPLPVHRLDKPTTGALILARNERTARSLSAKLRNPQPENNIQKTYLALVHRSLQPGDSGEIRQRLYITDGRVTAGDPPPKRRGIPTEERDSLTTWRCLASSPRSSVSLLQFGLHTGVKHQLRVVAASILRAPILGDRIYGSQHIEGRVLNGTDGRLFLHSACVELTRYLSQPCNGRRAYQLKVTAPLPIDFIRLCERFDVSVDPTWAQEPARITVNRTDVPFEHAEINEGIITAAVRGCTSAR